ncbi:complex I subunit 1 family protein [Anaeromyxobacter sp. Fw109-5]|uniref:complex I subunit 1/NuoH family protein n=1 Tax=Anaeromyxobacter sp. (strain Fw109-5) TaxID=404589 RepID=UPI0000ED7F61|nr:complex I subunit 1 family protein [Anaeromyxobacter sp. Fw109-5]ABS25493.1 NADH dehydrogenase (quinone) [Anaeromyxobacter sp. Fw109-5]
MATVTLPKGNPRTKLLLTVAVALALPVILFGAVLVLATLAKPEPVQVFVREVLGHDPATWPYTGLVFAAVAAALTFMILNFGAVVAAVTIWWEMRVSSRMQSRIGYNRVGAGGFFQWIADAVKLLLKEDLIPAESDRMLFRAAPYFVFAGFGLIFVALPFGESVIAADLNVGIYYITAVTALVVVGILLAGWSSNSKWALFGGMRSAAQVISYEIPAGLAVMVPILMAGTLSMQGIIRAQGAWPWQWFVFSNPAALIAFVIFFIAQLAESNRPPFDLPEAESELVAGYLAEYTAFRYAIFFLVEFGNVWIMSAIAVTLFFGGWQVPGVGAAAYEAARGAGALPAPAWWGLQVASMAVFFVKTFLVMNLVIWIRWTFPRIRVDQMMNLCWKYLVPGAFATFVATLLWQILVARVPAASTVSGVVLTVAAVLALVQMLRLAKRNVEAGGDQVDLSNW